MLATDRNQPIRVWFAAGPFSARKLASENGTSVKPSPSSPGSEKVALASNVDPIGGNTVLWSHAVGFPSGPSAAFMYIAATERYTSNLMSSSRLQTTFTGLPVFFESTPASTATSGNDFRPNPPPSSVT